MSYKEDAEVRLSSLEGTLVDIKSELDEVKANGASLEEEKRELIVTKDDLSKQLELTKSELTKQLEGYNDVKSKLDMVNESTSTLQTKLDDVTSENTTLHQKIAGLSKAVTSVKNVNQDFINKTKETNEIMTKMLSDKAKVDSNLNMVQVANKKLGQMVESKNKQKVKLMDDLGKVSCLLIMDGILYTHLCSYLYVNYSV